MNQCSLIFVLIYFFNVIWWTFFAGVSDSPSNIFYITSDRFADYVKVYFSLKSIVSTPEFLSILDGLPELFRNFYYNNPYKYPNVSGDALSIFHHPPLTFLYFVFSAHITSLGFSPSVLIIINLIFIFSLILCISNFLKNSNHFNLSSFDCFFIFINYPLLFAIDRGNFASIYCSIFAVLAIVVRRAGVVNYLLSIIALSVRPNIIFTFLFLRDFKSLSKLVVVFLVFSILLFWVCNFFVPEYTVQNFLSSMHVYNKLFISGSAGDMFNSSLYVGFKFISHKMDFSLVLLYCFALIFFAVAVWLAWGGGELYKVYIGAGFCMCATPVFGLYHLYLFTAPLLISVSRKYSHRFDAKIIALSSVVILSPKTGFVVDEYTIGTMVNPLIFFIVLLVLFLKKISYKL